MSDEGQQDDSQKTEDPTPKRLKEMRDKGQVAMSREINNWAMLFIGTVIIVALGPWMFSKISAVLKVFLESPHRLLVDPQGAKDVVFASIIQIGKYLLLPAILLIVVAIAAPFSQIGPIFSAETLKPSWDKISIIKGFGRLFSLRSIVEFIKGIVKLVIVGLVITWVLWPFMGSVSAHVGQSSLYMMEILRELTFRVMVAVLAVMFVVAALDFMYQRFEHLKKARMSRQEIKDEFKQTEGDPHVKGKLKQLRQERARQRMMAAVPEADVVITNPTHFAVALKYDPDKMNAPRMVAKGQDNVALRIRELAKESDVPIIENKPLARGLFAAMDIDDEIPGEHYKAVADIISYVFKLKNKKIH